MKIPIFKDTIQMVLL